MFNNKKIAPYIFAFLAFCVFSSKHIIIYNEEILVFLSFSLFVIFVSHYISLNKTYICSVGENSLSQNLAFNQFTPETSKHIYIYTLLKTLKNFCKQNTYLNKKK